MKEQHRDLLLSKTVNFRRMCRASLAISDEHDFKYISRNFVAVSTVEMLHGSGRLAVNQRGRRLRETGAASCNICIG